MQTLVHECSESENDEVDNNDPASANSSNHNETLFSWDISTCIKLDLLVFKQVLEIRIKFRLLLVHCWDA